MLFPPLTAAIELRALTRRDVPDVLAIERASFSDPWDEATLDAVLRARRTFTIAAELQGELCGYLVGEVEGRRVQVLNVCVDAPMRRRGVGSRLIGALTGQLDPRQRLLAIVAEVNLPAQHFYRARQFHVVSTLPNFGTARVNPDAYLFEYRPGERAAPYMPANRVAAYL